MGLLDNQKQQDYYSGNDFGNYQFISLDDIITQFQIAYVGEDKIISKIKRTDVAFHAQRALAELSFDTFKSYKSIEVEVGATLTEPLPQDYINYTRISWIDGAGIKHPLYQTNSTSNARPAYFKNSDDEYELKAVATLANGSSVVILDKTYNNIVDGMEVSGPSIPTGSYAYNVRNLGGVTRFELAEETNVSTLGLVTPGQGVTVNLATATYTGNETLTFSKPSDLSYNTSGDRVDQFEKTVVSTYTASGNSTTSSKYITLGSASDAEQVEVGMLAQIQGSLFFPTFVVDVQGTVITLSRDVQVATTGEVRFHLPKQNSTAWNNYKSQTPSENDQYDYEDDIYWPNEGRRYGLDPQHAQVNGSFYIDQNYGKIYFSSNISGKTVIIDYISDSLGTDEEMQVHKFAEEAMYKCISYAVLSSRINTPEVIVRRYKKEKFAETRKAKLRLSNLKLEELTQILRGKSKHIKH